MVNSNQVFNYVIQSRYSSTLLICLVSDILHHFSPDFKRRDFWSLSHFLVRALLLAINRILNMYLFSKLLIASGLLPRYSVLKQNGIGTSSIFSTVSLTFPQYGSSNGQSQNTWSPTGRRVFPWESPVSWFYKEPYYILPL